MNKSIKSIVLNSHDLSGLIQDHIEDEYPEFKDANPGECQISYKWDLPGNNGNDTEKPILTATVSRSERSSNLDFLAGGAGTATFIKVMTRYKDIDFMHSPQSKMFLRALLDKEDAMPDEIKIGLKEIVDSSDEVPETLRIILKDCQKNFLSAGLDDPDTQAVYFKNEERKRTYIDSLPDNMPEDLKHLLASLKDDDDVDVHEISKGSELPQELRDIIIKSLQ